LSTTALFKVWAERAVLVRQQFLMQPLYQQDLPAAAAETLFTSIGQQQ
jgi:hypothetical protein